MSSETVTSKNTSSDDEMSGHESSEKKAEDSRGVLFCDEKLDRTSPQLWPEKVPGMRKVIVDNSSLKLRDAYNWRDISSSEDMDYLANLGHMTGCELMSKIEELRNIAFELGIEEEKEVTRGSLIDVLSSSKQSSKKKMK